MKTPIPCSHPGCPDNATHVLWTYDEVDRIGIRLCKKHYDEAISAMPVVTMGDK